MVEGSKRCEVSGRRSGERGRERIGKQGRGETGGVVYSVGPLPQMQSFQYNPN